MFKKMLALLLVCTFSLSLPAFATTSTTATNSQDVYKQMTDNIIRMDTAIAAGEAAREASGTHYVALGGNKISIYDKSMEVKITDKNKKKIAFTINLKGDSAITQDGDKFIYSGKSGLTKAYKVYLTSVDGENIKLTKITDKNKKVVFEGSIKLTLK